MCLIVFAWRHHPDYRLIVAANRDEFHARPAAALHWWQDRPQLLAGRDLQGGGTWMGVSRTGRFAALTNYRDPSRLPPAAPSRGLLVRDALLAGDDTATTLERIATVSGQYAPFNLLVSDGETLGIHESSIAATRLLEPGLYGLSNHLLDTPWPKLLRARSHFAEAMKQLPAQSAFLTLLRDETAAPDETLPRTGVSLEWEKMLSPVFIRSADYGTRCSTLLTIAHNGEAAMREWRWHADGGSAGESEQHFAIG